MRLHSSADFSAVNSSSVLMSPSQSDTSFGIVSRDNLAGRPELGRSSSERVSSRSVGQVFQRGGQTYPNAFV